ncbi:PREDICTED: rhomboid-like protein 11, chloroplastic isoform X1 [Nicotiana attenuata]|uniref:Rhomboid-like protein 11, chloroplastic n=1 Tax=Nicotiana attenuata TaxID=49451 RepID=A0A314L2F0_NICAT|nr:PREDICTED: rhomboid-like protein 11, chloroplastic isoform X1 [Nicotiana attenuata]OIT35831.1 rhomboid-like protein 11, chloroplastic [Nicotiana attenuata]
MKQLQLQHHLGLKHNVYPHRFMPMAMPLSTPPPLIHLPKLHLKLKTSPITPTTSSRLLCKFNDSDMTSQLEILKPEGKKPEKRVNGIFWILLINLGIYVADHVFQVRAVKVLYLYHNWPAWYQFVTATFCHFNWNHLSSNVFFLYIFGKLVEEEEGNFGLCLSYIVTGAGANLVSWLILPRNAVSVGSSGAVFGLFAISVLVKMSWDWRKILEVLVLGQFVIERVMEAAQASTGLAGGIRGGSALQNVNHIAHLSGALIGVALIWLLSGISSQAIEPDARNKKK